MDPRQQLAMLEIPGVDIPGIKMGNVAAEGGVTVEPANPGICTVPACVIIGWKTR